MGTKLFKIGEVARLTGCSIQAIRYYEKEGLVVTTARSVGNYRLYSEDNLERLRFIHHCRNLGLTVLETKQILQLKDSPAAPCDTVSLIIRDHLQSIEQRINELKSLRKQFRELESACSTDNTVERCGILKQLSQD